MNFWQKLKKPFFCLAPMADVTDSAFRAILAKYSKTKDGKNQTVFWTEFVSADGLCHPLGRKKLAHILKFSKAEKPIVAQVFGADPVKMKKACQIISKLNFDGLDINMGCPDKSVIRQGAGSALIKNPPLAREIIQSAIAGANSLPVSVKTRIGFNKEEIDTWIPELLKENISALTVHLRTKKEMSDVPAHWEMMERVIKWRDKISPATLIIGNGDIKSLEEGRKRIKETGCDGVMIGRGVFGNPWFFKTTPGHNRPVHQNGHPALTKAGKGDSRQGVSLALEGGSLSSKKEKIKALVEHIKLFDKKLLKTGDKNFSVMKKHFKAYINGWDGAKELRNKLMLTETPKEAISILTDFQKTLK